MAQFQLNILGCGSAKPTPRHNPTCQVLDFRDNLFMIDCGEGSQTMFVRMGLKYTRLNHIFISHLHGDHCFGLPGLLSTLGLQGKGGTLTVHTFKDGAEMFGKMCEYFCRDMSYEVKFNVIEYGSDVIYEDDALKVTTIPLKHRVPTVGFLFEEKEKLRHINRFAIDKYNVPICYMNILKAGGDYIAADGSVTIPNEVLTTPPDKSLKYAYCSDTMPASKIIPVIEGADWLYHEATYGNEFVKSAKQRFHSTAHQAAEVAVASHAGNLVIGHYSSRYKDENILLNEAREVFSRTVLADEGLRIDMTKGFEEVK